MTTPDQQPTADNDNPQLASAQTAQPYPEGFAISPALGGLPPIYVPQSATRATTGAGLWRATIRAVRRAGCRAALTARIISRRTRGPRANTRQQEKQ
jgi:hypothetical protein